MKRNGFFVLGMLALVLTFGLVLAGCDNGTTNDGGGGGDTVSKFVGTWRTEAGNTLTFEKQSYSGQTFLTVTSTARWGGTCDISESTINLNGKWATFVFSNGDNTLTLSGTNDNSVDGVYQRQ